MPNGKEQWYVLFGLFYRFKLLIYKRRSHRYVTKRLPSPIIFRGSSVAAVFDQPVSVRWRPQSGISFPIAVIIPRNRNITRNAQVKLAVSPTGIKDLPIIVGRVIKGDVGFAVAVIVAWNWSICWNSTRGFCPKYFALSVHPQPRSPVISSIEGNICFAVSVEISGYRDTNGVCQTGRISDAIRATSYVPMASLAVLTEKRDIALAVTIKITIHRFI